MDKYIDPYEYTVNVNGEDVDFGFDGQRTVALFGGSYFVTHPEPMTLEDVMQDIKDYYKTYQTEDLVSYYRANGFYD